MGSWVRGRPRARVGIWDAPSTLSPVSLRIPSLPAEPRAPGQALPSSGLGGPSAEWVAGALRRSPTGAGIELPIIVHYCWQLPSLAGLRGNWPDWGDWPD